MELKKLSKSQLIEEIKKDRREFLSHQIAKTLRWLIVTVGVCICVYFISINFAGVVTIADINANVSYSDGKESSKLSYFLVSGFGIILGVIGVLFGWRQNDLRKHTVSRLHEYQLLYEKSIDPKRTSSDLTQRGDTREEDK